MRTYLVALALLFTIASLTAVLYVRGEAADEAENSAVREATFAAKLAATAIDDAFEESRQVVAGLGATPNLQVLVDEPAACSLSFSAPTPFTAGHLDVLAPDGTAVCSSDAAPGRDYGSEDWFADAEATPSVRGPVADGRSGDPAAVIFVRSPSGAVAAVFLDLKGLGSGLSARFGGPRDLVFLVAGGDGSTISRSVGAGTLSRDRSPEADIRSVPRLHGRAVASSTGWTVYAVADRASALEATDRLYRDLLIIVVGGLAIILAALAFVHRRITRPIHSLGLAVQKASSEGPGGSTSVGGPAEVQALEKRFDELLTEVSLELEERRRAEEAARLSELRYRLLYDANPIPTLLYDPAADRLDEVNDAAVACFGYERAEFLELGLADLFASEIHEAVRLAVASDEEVSRSGPWTGRTKEGQSIQVEVSSHPTSFEGSDKRLILAEDVSQRHHLEHQLRQAQRLESLGRLAGGVAHDFNNLLSVILNYGAFVGETLEQLPRTEEIREARNDLEQVRSAADRAAALTRQLLAFARQEVVHPTVVDVNGIVAEVETLLQRTIGEDIEFTVSLLPDLWAVFVDPGQLEQVILNLAINARDAMPDGGVLNIETTNFDVDEAYASAWRDLSAGRYVRIRVSDTGIGMPPDVAERVFEPFFTTKPKGEGTGLGLSTSHGIVTQAGGSMHLYTEPGVGTSISVMLPVTEEREVAEMSAPVHDQRGEETVLVVEDEKAIREVTRRMLERNGYKVLVAASGKEAIEIAGDLDTAIDVVITDVVMPQMLGKEVTERLSEIRSGIPIIYISGYAQSILDSRGRLEQGRMLLEKPFSQVQLLTAVREVLD